MMRIVLFLFTNLAVMLLFSIVMMFINIQISNIINLLIISSFVGFFGSIVSLLMSKYISLLSVNGRILKNAENKVESWLLNIVRIQSNKLNLVMPEVAIYDSCNMNAFATGFRKNSALVAVSTGLLQSMTHDEIEAVIAHEMSHISNGDMVTMSLIQGVINTFVIFISRILAQFIYYCLSSVSSEDSSKNSDSENYLIENNSSIYYFISMILESLFGILASMIVLWFSRYREFYADAGSANLVGSDKMIAALQKLKLSDESNESSIVSSFCINSSRMSDRLSELFMSHPSLDKRIEALRCGKYVNRSSFFHNNGK